MDDFWYMEKLGEGAFGKVVGADKQAARKEHLNKAHGFANAACDSLRRFFSPAITYGIKYGKPGRGLSGWGVGMGLGLGLLSV